ncbi:MAG: rhombosortase [Proteobacteria bacterium]|nr:rhombosortase [Pseudomonadota bacterium]
MGLHKDAETVNARRLLAAAVAVAAIVLRLGGGEVEEALAFDRAALEGGQLWRLVSGHFVHLGWSHLFLNLAGLALVTWLVGAAFGALRWLVVGLVTVVAIDAGFWWLNPQLDWYVGLSGLLHGLLAAGLLAGVVRRRDREAAILAVFVVAKLCWEQLLGPLPGSESTSGGRVIVDAHLYGAVGGVLGGLLAWRRVGGTAPL